MTGPGGAKSWAHGTDVLVGMNANDPNLDVSAPLVFVGYGVDAPEQKWNDMFNDKSILITGGTGSFGKKCIEVLLQKYI